MEKSDTTRGIVLMLVSALSAGIGQLFWKLSSTNSLYLLSGFILYGFGALVMIRAYRFGQLSVLQPVLSISYVLSVVLGSVFLGELVTIGKLVGVTLICIGVFCLARGDKA